MVDNSIAKEKPEDNTLAYNTQGKIVHIDEVESGKKGYFCIDCDGEKIAVKGKIAHHFRHVATDVKYMKNCSYSDETYRHGRAKDILQMIKKVKVPALYKDPPIGVVGESYKIRNSWFVEANKVLVEKQFYEDEDGIIRWGSKIDFKNEANKDKNLLIQPDIAFFDLENNPSLLIELVATNKVDNEKIAKVRRLGIDMIEVKIPRESEEAIEKNFYVTKNTIWIYNNEREQFKYIQNTSSNNKKLSQISELQRAVYSAESTFKCRSSEIRNFIRAIKKILGSDIYRQTELRIRREIQKVEINTEKYHEKWTRIQDGVRGELARKFKQQEEQLREEESELTKAEKQFNEYYGELENTFKKSRRRLEQKKEDYRPKCQLEIDATEIQLNQSEKARDNIERQVRQLEINNLKFGEEVETKIRRSRKKIEEIEEAERRIPIRIEENTRENRERLHKKFANDKTRARTEFENTERKIKQGVRNRDRKRIFRNDERIEILLQIREALQDIRTSKSELKRLRKAKELLDSGKYKEWFNPRTNS